MKLQHNESMLSQGPTGCIFVK